MQLNIRNMKQFYECTTYYLDFRSSHRPDSSILKIKIHVILWFFWYSTNAWHKCVLQWCTWLLFHSQLSWTTWHISNSMLHIVLFTRFVVITGQRKSLNFTSLHKMQSVVENVVFKHTSCSKCFIINIKGHLLSLASKKRLFFHLHHCSFDGAM